MKARRRKIVNGVHHRLKSVANRKLLAEAGNSVLSPFQGWVFVIAMPPGRRSAA